MRISMGIFSACTRLYCGFGFKSPPRVELSYRLPVAGGVDLFDGHEPPRVRLKVVVGFPVSKSVHLEGPTRERERDRERKKERGRERNREKEREREK